MLEIPRLFTPKRLFFTSIGRRGEDARVWFGDLNSKFEGDDRLRCLLNFEFEPSVFNVEDYNLCYINVMIEYYVN